MKKDAKPVGRPSILNPKRAEKIYERARAGRSRYAQARAGGINVGTLCDWRARGEKGDERKDGGEPSFEEFAEQLAIADDIGEEADGVMLDDMVEDKVDVPPAVRLNALTLKYRLRGRLDGDGQTQVVIQADNLELPVGDASKLSSAELMESFKGEGR